MSVNIRITPAAAAFYREELELTTHQALRLFVRIGGFGNGGYSVGVQIDRPHKRDYRIQVNGVTFLISPDDAWYMEGLQIDYDPVHGICCSNGQCQELHHPEPATPAIAMAV